MGASFKRGREGTDDVLRCVYDYGPGGGGPHDDVAMRVPTFEREGQSFAVIARPLPLCVVCCDEMARAAQRR